MKRLVLGSLLAGAISCNGNGTGSVQIFVVPEDTIVNGLQPGSDLENVQDGWTIAYQRYLVSIGNFRATRSDTGDHVADPRRWILDLKHAPTSGYIASGFDDLDAVTWDRFGYDIPNATPGALPIAPTADADADFMIQNHYSVYYEGTGVNGDVTITFKWGFSAGTSYDDCETLGGVPGFAVPASGTVQLKPTLHGDHQFFDNLTEGVEITTRLAQWLETCDLDGNRDVTLDELKSCDVITAMPQPPYDLTGARDVDGNGKLSVYDVVFGEMQTFGHFQGDGDCPTRATLP